MKSIPLSLKTRNAGVTLVEVVVGILVLAITALLVARAHLSISTAEDTTKKRSLASQVCMQLMDEMRHLGMEGSDAKSIEDYDDGDKLNSSLSTLSTQASSPAHRMLLRQINVFHVPGEPRSRRVRVRVFEKRSKNLLAETIGFIRIYAEDSPSIQIANAYLLPSLEMGGTAQSFLNPRLSDWSTNVVWQEPRDLKYRPKYLFNKSGPPFNQTYTDEPTDLAYLTTANDSTDMFNHLERYPPEAARYTAALQDYLTQGPIRSFASSRGLYFKRAGLPLPPLRYLLNEMAAGNPEYRHSLLQNSGIFFALPPMRNYSDAAKSPGTQPYVRAVLHPEHIHYNAGEAVKLRVYTYVTRPDSFATNATTNVTVRIATPIASGNISIRRMAGSDTVQYQWQPTTAGIEYTIDPRSTETVITLINSPLRHPPKTGGTGPTRLHQGIDPFTERLYGMEYIPCLVSEDSNPGPAPEEFEEGEEDLADNNSSGLTNNTARWVITIQPGATPTGLLPIVTYLGNDTSPHDPPNLSTTYAWVGVDVPLTERYQLLGDPRHMPYADVKHDHGYNWYFTKVDTSDGYKHFDKTKDGWEYDHKYPNPGVEVTQRLNFDFPRYMYIYRTALLNSNSSLMLGDSSDLNLVAPPLSFVTLGRSYIGFGNVAWGGPPLRCPQTAWVPTSSALATPDEVAPPTTFPTHTHKNQRLVARTDNSWFCLPWLGELYPDDQYANWVANGNLPTGPGNFYRAPYSVFSSTFGYPTARDFAFQAVGAGLSTLINGNNTTDGGGSKFVYNPFQAAQTATYVPLWKNIEQIFFNFQGRNSDYTSSRFRLDENSADSPPGYNDAVYKSTRTHVDLVDNFMTPSSSGNYPYVAGILRMTDPDDENRSAWVLLNGNDEQSTRYDFLKYAMNRVMSIWSFLEMGSPSLPKAIRAQPIPRVSFTAPDANALLENPTTLSLAWTTQWLRWDGKPYIEGGSTGYPNGFVPDNPTVTYSLLYSNDNRLTWWDITRPGQETAPLYRPWSTGLTPPYSWDVSSLPAGRYVLRLEAYRGENAQHAAYHERRIEITRP